MLGDQRCLLSTTILPKATLATSLVRNAVKLPLLKERVAGNKWLALSITILQKATPAQTLSSSDTA